MEKSDADPHHFICSYERLRTGSGRNMKMSKLCTALPISEKSKRARSRNTVCTYSVSSCSRGNSIFCDVVLVQVCQSEARAQGPPGGAAGSQQDQDLPQHALLLLRAGQVLKMKWIKQNQTRWSQDISRLRFQDFGAAIVGDLFAHFVSYLAPLKNDPLLV